MWNRFSNRTTRDDSTSFSSTTKAKTRPENSPGKLASVHPRGERLHVVRAAHRPTGWVGKMWAVETGIRQAEQALPDARYLLLTDADVEHGPSNLRRLVARAETERLDLVSLMVRLHCKSGWEKLLIPAFVYFFQQLYPFPRINDPGSRTAGGGRRLHAGSR